MNLIKSFYAKLDRAHEHRDALQREIESLSERNSYFLVREKRNEGREHVFRIHFLKEPDRVRWGLIFGDSVHNLRSALDHLVVAIAASVHGDFPPPDFHRLMFPISESPSKFDNAKRCVQSLPEGIQAVIEELQPYQTRDSDPFSLQLLHDFDITDKHRLVQVVLAMTDEAALVVENLKPGSNSFQSNALPLEEGSVVLSVTGPEPTDYLDIKGELTLAITVRHRADAQGQGISYALGRLDAMRREVEYISRVLQRFIG